LSSVKPDDGERMGDPTSADSLEELLRRFHDGDPEGFAGLYRIWARRLFATAIRMLGRREDAEDAMQEAFLRFHAKGSALRADQATAWMHRVLINVCLDRIRRAGRRPESALDDGMGSGAPRAGAVRIDLARAVRDLPDRARSIFIMHDVEGMKHREIAEALGLTVGGTKSQLFRARETLRNALSAGRGEAE